jgi:hypothetical protein
MINPLLRSRVVTHSTVVVLGMHRSGTSVAASLVRRLGVYMGDRLMPAYESNPLGHFEALEFVELNDQILVHCGGSWNDPPKLNELLGSRRRFARQIRNLVRERNSHHAIWGWKDPRTVLTFDHYVPYLVSPRLMVCSRSCEAVSHSLAERDRSGVAANQALCLEYEKRLMRLLSKYPFPRIFIDYDRLRSDPVAEVSRIDAFLGAGTDEETLRSASKLVLDDAGLEEARARLKT